MIDLGFGFLESACAWSQMFKFNLIFLKRVPFVSPETRGFFVLFCFFIAERLLQYVYNKVTLK